MIINGWILVEGDPGYARCGAGGEVIQTVVASHSGSADAVVTTPPIFTGAWMGWSTSKTETVLLESSFLHADTRHKAKGESAHGQKELG